ncbi:class I SAM-dependent methyltransferase [Kitasatospora sp. NPDC049285]|uniref:class I SAM-dependent methyltransferase n=1 Tax=Kitasatospora sp. NPDC049285 TaxID=3157096 RepID=UPI00341A4367
MTTPTRTRAQHAAALPQPNADRWPDVARVPRAPLRARAAWAVFTRAVRDLPLSVELPPTAERPGTDGRLGAGGPVLRVHRPAAFAARLGTGGLVGFGESYLAGEWDADDPTAVLTVLAERLDGLVPPVLQSLRRLVLPRRRLERHGTVEAARRDVSAHYDLSNDLFAAWLDESMTYSAALFDTDPAGRPVAAPELLTAAQHRKIDRLLDATGVGPGVRVLEIGTGWGELALRAAARGADVVSLTLSHQQRDLARQRIARAGLADRVAVELSDYREVRGRYDVILSVEMIEAVGYRYWPVYFRTLDERLAPGGRIGLQAITMPHERMLRARDTFTFIDKYVFPGGQLVSTEAVDQHLAATSLRVTDRLSMGAHYAETLRLWREAFTAAAPAIDAQGFDETFRRMWTLYLAYSEAGFRSGFLDTYQLLIERP